MLSHRRSTPMPIHSSITIGDWLCLSVHCWIYLSLSFAPTGALVIKGIVPVHFRLSSPHPFSSDCFSAVLPQVSLHRRPLGTLGLPLFLFTGGLLVRPAYQCCWQTSLRVWPSQLHFLLMFCQATAHWLAPFHTPCLVICSSQWIQRILHRQEVWSMGGHLQPPSLMHSQLYLRASPFFMKFLHIWLFFNPTIEVVTFRLCGWWMLGVFLLPAFTRLEHECQDLFESVQWNACVHRQDLGLYSHPKYFLGNGVRTHVNAKGIIPSTEGSEQGWASDAASCRTVSPKHYWLSDSSPQPPSNLTFSPKQSA